MSSLNPRDAVGLWTEAKVWRPRNARLLLADTVGRDRRGRHADRDDDRVRAAASWLGTAQDATTDGGVVGRYHIATGWTSSYPETTGYLIPTLLELAREPGLGSLEARARRAFEFLLPLQLDSGAFPGGEVHENRSKPSIFNSAQIINGLVAWHRHSGDERALGAARRAGDWLVEMLDDDGAWRRHTYIGLPVAYAAHASCWLAELGAHTGESRYLDGARRHLEWVLSLADPSTGWIDKAGFWPEQHERREGHTHTIAYTIWGVLYTAGVLGHARGLAAAERAALGVLRRLELSRWLPGELDSRWRGRANYACITGNAQMALIWMRLHEQGGDLRFANAALRAIDLVKRAQVMSTADPSVYGAVPGSDPVWGGYITLAYPNWAAKFFVDALLAKRRMLERIEHAAPVAWRPPPSVGDAPAAPAAAITPRCRVVVYAAPDSPKLAQALDWWKHWGFKPVAVVLENRPGPGALRRAAVRVRDDGVGAILAAAARRLGGRTNDNTGWLQEIASYPGPRDVCARTGIPLIEVADLQSPEGLAVVRSLKPDLALHTGGTILRAPLLAVPSIGTLNAHMGLLPRYRGVNVSEWSVLEGGPVGATVHLVDEGIDTGPIVAMRRVSADGLRSVDELRKAVARAQLELLGDVVAGVVASGTPPTTTTQDLGAGQQYFTMHPELRSIVERRLQAEAQ